MTDIDGTLALIGAKLATVGGYNHKDVLTAVDLDPQTLTKRKVPWSQFVAMSDHVYQLAGSDAEAVRWGSFYSDLAPKAVRAMFAATMTPRRLHKLALAGIKQLYPPIELEELEYTRERGVYRLTVREGFAAARSFFVFNAGATMSTGRYLGLPPTPVSWQADARTATFEVSFQPVPTLSDRVNTFLSQLTTPSQAQVPLLDQAALEESASSDRQGISETEQVSAQWKLTPRQEDVLRQLVAGASNKEIADALGCSTKTVEHHVTAILRASGSQTRAEVVAKVWKVSTV